MFFPGEIVPESKINESGQVDASQSVREDLFSLASEKMRNLNRRFVALENVYGLLSVETVSCLKSLCDFHKESLCREHPLLKGTSVREAFPDISDEDVARMEKMAYDSMKKSCDEQFNTDVEYFERAVSRFSAQLETFTLEQLENVTEDTILQAITEHVNNIHNALKAEQKIEQDTIRENLDFSLAACRRTSEDVLKMLLESEELKASECVIDKTINDSYSWRMLAGYSISVTLPARSIASKFNPTHLICSVRNDIIGNRTEDLKGDTGLFPSVVEKATRVEMYLLQKHLHQMPSYENSSRIIYVKDSFFASNEVCQCSLEEVVVRAVEIVRLLLLNDPSIEISNEPQY